jgi:hypothetical protein
MGNLTFSPYSNDIRFNKGGAIWFSKQMT